MSGHLPKTLLEAVRYFSDEDVCVAFVASLRWPNGPICPRCGGGEHSYLKTRRLWKCKGCKKQFSVKVGSLFEDSPIKLGQWLPAIWMIANSKNGVSSHELARAVGVTQKSAWFMLHRIRLAMQTGSFEKFDSDSEIEVDETFVGGAARFMHKDVRKRRITGTGPNIDKTPVFGMLNRGGEVRAFVVPDNRTATVQGQVRRHIEPGAQIYSDALRSYRTLSRDYAHAMVDHAERYAIGRVHTNGIENFWSLLKRGLKGTYVAVAPFHLTRYVDERVFTFNERHRDDLGRFVVVLSRVAGRRLTYAELTSHP